MILAPCKETGGGVGSSMGLFLYKKYTPKEMEVNDGPKESARSARRAGQA